MSLRLNLKTATATNKMLWANRIQTDSHMADHGTGSLKKERQEAMCVVKSQGLTWSNTLTSNEPIMVKRIITAMVETIGPMELSAKAEKAMELVKGAADLNAVASAWEEQIQNVGDLQFSSFSIAGIGPEGNVLGSVFSLEPNEVSAPIQGDRGVFVLQVTKYTDQAGATNEQVLADLERGYQGRVDFEVFNALKEHAKIVDNRAKFY